MTTIETSPEHPLDLQKLLAESRARTNAIMNGERIGRVVLIGACAEQVDTDLQIREREELVAMRPEVPDIQILMRANGQKQRSKVIGRAEPWAGSWSTDRAAALVRAKLEFRAGRFNAAEIVTPDYALHVGPLLGVGWTGARSHDDKGLEEALGTLELSDLPIGVKNDTSGDICSALRRMDRIDSLRGNQNTFLIYRGGEKIKSVQEWESGIIKASQATNGKLMADAAHDSETIHDLKRLGRKTVDGQQAAASHILDLMADGLDIRGLMMESSNVDVVTRRLDAGRIQSRLTDPNMPLQFGKDIIRDVQTITAGVASWLNREL
jgi:3-deoxy-D-arabino-heptulosonate 7-phosphate (DAHP) synthase